MYNDFFHNKDEEWDPSAGKITHSLISSNLSFDENEKQQIMILKQN